MTWIRVAGWLNGVNNFSFHKHLPHAVTSDDASLVKVLATQPIDMSKPPATKRGGEILLADSTVFSTLFGADDSLKRFWTNPATVKISRVDLPRRR